MREVRATAVTAELRPGRRVYAWLIVLLLVIGAHACVTPGDLDSSTQLDQELYLSASPPHVTAGAGVARGMDAPMVKPSPTPAPLPSASTSDHLPTLSVIVTHPAPIPTPFPDEEEIVQAVLGTGTGEHWTTHLVSGSFTAPGADERLALVGNVGDENEMRSVVIGQTEDGLRLLGASEPWGTGFDSPPSFYLPPDLLDFDADGRQEVLSHYFRVQWGWTVSADTLYRWDGHGLARIWHANTIVDNRMADDGDVPQPYRQNYRAEWEWVDLDDDHLDEILLRERVTFHPIERPRWGDGEIVLGAETWERVFRWDGETLRPSAPDGPADTFAYVALGDLWLWQDRFARPLEVGYVRDVRWSPDGLRLAWWAQPPTIGGSPGAILGIYNLRTDAHQKLYLQGELLALRWTPSGRLVYTLANGSVILLDPKTEEQELFPASLGTWSPSGGRIAYQQGGNLYLYDLSAGQERSLVIAPEEGETEVPATLSDPVWSPRGDWIACLLHLPNQGPTHVGLVAPDLTQPLSRDDLLRTFVGWETSELQFAWSPDGSRLAALTTDLHAGRRPTALYLAKVPSPGYDPEGQLEWQKVVQLEAVTQTARLAWSPGGDRVTLAVGDDIWEATIGSLRSTSAGPETDSPNAGWGPLQTPNREPLAAPLQAESTASKDVALRGHFSIPEPEWTVLAWAPDGSGFLVGLAWAYDEHLYWFPANGAEPTLLLAGSLSGARWAPRPRTDEQPQPPMVLVEHTDNVPLIHFVDKDGADTVVPARGAQYNELFQVGGGRVYHEKSYTDRGGGVSLFISDMLDDCHPPIVSPDGSQLAWLCDDGPPDARAMIEGTAEVHFRLIVTDGQGRDPREIWSHVETGPNYRDLQLKHWRVDGEVIYLSRPRYRVAWAYFDYNPGILALDVDTGQVAQVGDLDGVHDALVSPDGAWLVQSKVAKWPSTGVSITLRSLVDGTEHSVTCADGSMVAGDFSFSPGNSWLAWREWGMGPDGASILIRALPLPDGEPLAVYKELEPAAPQIGGWLRGGDLVLVYPAREGGIGGYGQESGGTGRDVQEEGTTADAQEKNDGETVQGDDARGYSTVVALPSRGPGLRLSPFTFLGILGEVP